jgi:NADH:ubiquinone oxidoreductase subunit 6 (subunit J)
MILTLGMWAHVMINGIVCFEPTENPIWGELRLVGVMAATAALWMLLAATL